MLTYSLRTGNKKKLLAGMCEGSVFSPRHPIVAGDIRCNVKK